MTLASYSASPMEEPCARGCGWKISRLRLSPDCCALRGFSSTGRHGGTASLHVRTNDAAFDEACVRAIAQGMSLKEVPASQAGGLEFSASSFSILVLFEKSAGKVPGHYAIHASMASPRTLRPCESLAMAVGLRVFEAKEKPHFRDGCSAAFEAALAGS